jgi:hypothetical protein
MRDEEVIKKFKIYISYVPNDSAIVGELYQFLTKNISPLKCVRRLYDKPDEPRIRLWAIKAIRTCDVFILLITKNSIKIEGWIKEFVSQEYAEALSFKRNIICIFLEDKNFFLRVLFKGYQMYQSQVILYSLKKTKKG